MDATPFSPPDASSTDAAVSTATRSQRIGWFEGHLPDIVDALDPPHPETAFTDTRHLRHDGWTPDKKRRFLERFAECGVVKEACLAAGMSARSAYNLRDRDPLFAAGMDAACAMARPRLADEAFSRAMNGVVERIYKDGEVVAERHRYDNRLTMAVLRRLDERVDRAQERGDAHLRIAAHWDDYLAAVAQDRQEDALALLVPPGPAPQPKSVPAENARERELRELHPGNVPGAGRDWHDVWDEGGLWWTDYPPPSDFDGEEEGSYGEDDYRRTLSPAELAVIESEEAAALAGERALAEGLRDAYFGLAPGVSSAPKAEQAAEVGRTDPG